jgi:hypothetical protein
MYCLDTTYLNNHKMTEKELRIGNWVIFPYKGKVNFDNGAYYGKIKGIHAGAATNFDDDIFQAAAFPVNMLKPIPLTTELLNSCLIYDGSEWYLQDHTAWSIQKYGGRFGLAYGGDLSKETWVQYLHQLQNLFYSLTGTELEINLSEKHGMES